jgi:hypothetical protein
MNGRRVVIAAFILLLLVGGGVVALLASRGSDGERRGVSERQAGSASTTTPSEPASGPVPIRFVIGSRYAAGETVDVGIENIGQRAYVFQSYYQACFLSYFDSSGRRFNIPPGTHCDLLAEETIRPGERKELFSWKLDECVKDRWGCVKSRPLPPGTYTIKGRFKPKAGGPTAHAEAAFTIVATATV